MVVVNKRALISRNRPGVACLEGQGSFLASSPVAFALHTSLNEEPLGGGGSGSSASSESGGSCTC